MIVFPCFSHMIPFSSHLLYNRCPHARFHTENLGAGGRARETHLLMILLPDKGHKEVEVEGATALLNHFRSMHCCIYVYIIICIYIYIYIFDYFSYILIYNHIYIYMYMIDYDCLWCIYHYRSLSRRETSNTIWGSSSLTCGVLPQASGLRNFIAATFACAGMGDVDTEKWGHTHIYIYVYI